jgi:hypothetical protein
MSQTSRPPAPRPRTPRALAPFARTPRAANDNAPARLLPSAGGGASPALLRAALEHFARTGLGAAEAALAKAEAAGTAGDWALRGHWLSLAALFDRRRAAAASKPGDPPFS